MYKPTWSDYEEKMKTSEGEEQRRNTDEFIKERELETSTSQKARDWENARKKEWAENKPEWVKKRKASEKSLDPSQQLIEEIRDGGVHEERLIPSRGYLLIRIEREDETTDSGIVIAHDDLSEPNTAIVVEVGDDLILDKHVVPTPVKVGARILFKKFAGMEITVKGEPLRMIQFSDVLGELI